MSSMINLSVLRSNDTLINLAVTYQLDTDWVPLPLSGITPIFILKATQTSADGTGITYAVGSGLTITSSRLGEMQVAIPGTALATPGVMWYRCDLTSVNGTNTALYGNIYILAA